MKANMTGGLTKSTNDPAQQRLADYLNGPDPGALAKEWSLTNPISTGILAFDLEAPSKLIFPRSSPLRNSLPRLKGQGASRRFKVINSVTGSGTGTPTTQPGINETTYNTGPGGLQYIRPPYISYSGYDVVQSYVSYGLSDSVSW